MHRGRSARERVISAEEVIAANPDIIIASWCGKPVKLDQIANRPGFNILSAVKSGQLHSIDSDIILQPGPRVLEGARELHRIFHDWRSASVDAVTGGDAPKAPAAGVRVRKI